MTKRGRKANARRTTASRPSKSAVTLSDEWRQWALENLTTGAPAADVVATLVENGVPSGLARSEVQALQRSPLLAPYLRALGRIRQLEMVARLRTTHLGFSEAGSQIPRVSWPSAATFFDHYYANNRPIVFTDAIDTWPARNWTFESLKSRFGKEPVDVCTGREADDTPDRNFALHQTTLPFRDFIDRVLSVGTSNDLYLIANNRALQAPAFSELFDDIEADGDVFNTDVMKGASSLWIGPAGTVTPLHHDVSNILFCQIQGKKRVTLIPPSETQLLDHLDGYYCAWPGPPFEGVYSVTTELTAGESLLIPAGWFHHVEALEPSINFSLLCFRRPNDLSWFAPGNHSKK